MGAYILRRLLLMIPTLLGIMAISFVIVQFAPGGPVEEMIARLTNNNVAATTAVTGSQTGDVGLPGAAPKNATVSGGTGSPVAAITAYRGSRGLRQDVIDKIVMQF